MSSSKHTSACVVDRIHSNDRGRGLRTPGGARWRGVLASLGVVCSLTVLASCGGSEEAKRPNVVLVVVDTLRADAIAGPGGDQSTPALERLAADGVQFTQALAHAPMTLPSHTSLLSSRHPFETGVLNNNQAVPEDLPLLQEWMQSRGYETRAVISMGTLWHPEGRPGLSRGFEDYDMESPRIVSNADAANVNDAVRASLAKRDVERPLFLFVHYCDPHDPYLAHGTATVEARVRLDGQPLGELSLSDSAQWIRPLELSEGTHVVEIDGDVPFYPRRIEMFCGEKRLARQGVPSSPFVAQSEDRIEFEVPAGEGGAGEIRLWLSDEVPQAEAIRRYVLEVEHVDRYVGELLESLRAEGLYEKSLVILVSDHGEGLGQHDTLGHVQNLSDSLIKVPLIIKMPAGHPRSEKLRAQANHLVPLIDLAPTILDVVGLPDLPAQRGSSLLRERQPLHIAETHVPEAAKDMISLRDDRYKLVYIATEDRFEMFDMVEDPNETKDLFSTLGARREAWQDQLRSIAEMAKTGAGAEDIDEETQRILDSLGYAGRR